MTKTENKAKTKKKKHCEKLWHRTWRRRSLRTWWNDSMLGLLQRRRRLTRDRRRMDRI